MVSKSQLIRFEALIARLWEKGRINAPIHLSGGSEDAVIEVFKNIKPTDYVFSTHRNHYHALLHGLSPRKILREILGREDGLCKGRARSMCLIDHSRHFYSSAIVGGMCAPAVGVAWALKQKGQRVECSIEANGDLVALTDSYYDHVWCFIGDGCMDTGHFYEAYRYAVCQDLPITFVCENNDRSTCTSIKERWGSDESVLVRSNKLIEYRYEAQWPHVSTGKYVQF
jgi:TPP-dependent pyruvate/acetoin dehydrogenase alpha subunit